MWFDSWSDIARVVFVGTAAYGSLVLVLRLSDKRTLSQLSAFDFIVTVALGSTLATILLSSDVSWGEGVTALALLAGLQWVVAAVTSRRPASRKVTTAQPRHLRCRAGVERHTQRHSARATRRCLGSRLATDRGRAHVATAHCVRRRCGTMLKA